MLDDAKDYIRHYLLQLFDKEWTFLATDKSLVKCLMSVTGTFAFDEKELQALLIGAKNRLTTGHSVVQNMEEIVATFNEHKTQPMPTKLVV